jgi:signal transduction histidine kinase
VEKIRVARDYATAPPAIWVDVPHLKTCFMNLVLNAFQAMPDGGEFRVTAAGVTRKEDSSAAEPAAGWLEIRFRDSGTGIQAEDLPKVFEPYFTTKAVGIGLGLALTKQIVEEHGGRIEISSDPGQGTEVRLRLPVGAPQT